MADGVIYGLIGAFVAAVAGIIGKMLLGKIADKPTDLIAGWFTKDAVLYWQVNELTAFKKMRSSVIDQSQIVYIDILNKSLVNYVNVTFTCEFSEESRCVGVNVITDEQMSDIIIEFPNNFTLKFTIPVINHRSRIKLAFTMYGYRGHPNIYDGKCKHTVLKSKKITGNKPLSSYNVYHRPTPLTDVTEKELRAYTDKLVNDDDFYGDFPAMFNRITNDSASYPVREMYVCGSILKTFVELLDQGLNNITWAEDARVRIVLPNPDNTELIRQCCYLDYKKAGTPEEVEDYRRSLLKTITSLHEIEKDLRKKHPHASLEVRILDVFIWYRIVCVNPMSTDRAVLYLKEYLFRDPEARGTNFGGLYPFYDLARANSNYRKRFHHYKKLFESFFAHGTSVNTDGTV